MCHKGTAAPLLPSAAGTGTTLVGILLVSSRLPADSVATQSPADVLMGHIPWHGVVTSTPVFHSPPAVVTSDGEARNLPQVTCPNKSKFSPKLIRVPSGMISPTRSAVKPRVCSSCERKAATVSSAPKLSMTASSLSPGKVGSITCRSVLQFDGSAKSPNRGCVCRAAVVLATPSDADSPGLSPPSTSRRHVGLTLASPPMAAFTGPLHVALCTPSEAQ